MYRTEYVKLSLHKARSWPSISAVDYVCLLFKLRSIYLSIYLVPSISFQTFLYRHLNCCWLLKIQYIIAIQLIRWLANFYDFWFKWTATAAIGIHPDCHSWWISKMQSGREDTFQEWYAIKFCFQLGKNATETYGMFQTAFRPSCMNRVGVFEWHKRFNEGRKSVRDDERCGRSKEVNIPLLIGQTVRVRVTMLRF